MLRNKIKEYFDDKNAKPSDLEASLSKYIQNAVEKNDTAPLDQLFGPDAYKAYLTDAQIADITRELKEKKLPMNEEVLYQHYNTMFLRLGFYYACRKGNSLIAKYFMNQQHMPGDLMLDRIEYQSTLDPKGKLKGTPLIQAVKSNNIELVKYIYDNSESTIESSIGQPLHKTALMMACEANNVELAEYLLEKGANPNAEKFASFSTYSPLTIAIRLHSSAMIRVLIANGAVVSNKEVNLALTKNLDLDTIDLLLNTCVNEEDSYYPYILSAIKSGNLNLFHAIENNSSIKSIDEIAEYDDEPIAKRLLMAGAASGSVDMMKHLIEERKLDIKPLLAAEYDYFEKHKKEGFRELHNSTESILYYAACNNENKNVVPLLQYLFSLVQPSEAVIKKLCSKGIYQIQTVAYLHNLIETIPSEFDPLHKIAHELDQLNLVELFKIYNTKFVQNGNKYYEMNGTNFTKEIEARISSKLKDLNRAQICHLIENDEDAARGALFYYCTWPFNKKPEMLIYLLIQLTMHKDVFHSNDIQNCNGDTLASYASRKGCDGIVMLLVARGTNPDLPNDKGETLLTRSIYVSSATERNLPWMQAYIELSDLPNAGYAIQNSLLYEAKQTFGGYVEIETLLKLSKGLINNHHLKELIVECKKGHNNEKKVQSLLSHLSPLHLCDMVRLVKHEGLANILNESQLNYYFSRINDFDLKKLMESTYKPGSPALFAQSVVPVEATSDEPKESNKLTK